jgi:7SK snRNA methylphosphate capping enzyme
MQAIKRTADQFKDGPASKRRNTGNSMDLRRKHSRYINPVALTDPLNLNAPTQDSSTSSDKLFAGAGLIHQRRLSFRSQSKKQNTAAIPEEPKSSAESANQKAKKDKMNSRYSECYFYGDSNEWVLGYGNFNFHRQHAFYFDPRVDLLCDDWFKGKSVLDVGCNAGIFTLSIAKMFGPRRILGVDIDSHLIGAARKNIRQFQDKDLKVTTHCKYVLTTYDFQIVGRFPASFPLKFGAVSNPPLVTSSSFPENIWFKQENYVLQNDAELEGVIEEYDVIIAFSLSKWIHLNFGDEGIKRFFKRVYRQLKPCGRFIFEAQSTRGYRKRASMVPEMEQNYKRIQFWPDQWSHYLSNEIGFVHYETLDNPLAQNLGKLLFHFYLIL